MSRCLENLGVQYLYSVVLTCYRIEKLAMRFFAQRWINGKAIESRNWPCDFLRNAGSMENLGVQYLYFVILMYYRIEKLAMKQPEIFYATLKILGSSISIL